MNHEKIIVTEQGDKVVINVSFWLDYDKPCYDIGLSICKKGKRKFHPLSFGDDYLYRALSMPDRRKFMEVKNREWVTDKQILEAKTELWKLLSPNAPNSK